MFFIKVLDGSFQKEDFFSMKNCWEGGGGGGNKKRLYTKNVLH